MILRGYSTGKYNKEGTVSIIKGTVSIISITKYLRAQEGFRYNADAGTVVLQHPYGTVVLQHQSGESGQARFGGFGPKSGRRPDFFPASGEASLCGPLLHHAGAPGCVARLARGRRRAGGRAGLSLVPRAPLLLAPR